MFPHLRLMLIALWTPTVAGLALVVGLSMGHYSWVTFVLSAVAGVAIGVPAALLTWARLRPRKAREVGLTGL